MFPILLCCFLMIILYPMGIDLYLVAVPSMAASLHTDPATLQGAFSAYLLAMAASVLPAGALAERIGRRPLVLAGALLFAIASLVAANATALGPLLIARALQGCAAGTLYVMTFTVLRDTLPASRLAAVLSVVNGVICVIPVLAPVLGFVLLAHWPWSSLFHTMALLGLLVFGVTALLLRESRPAERSVQRRGWPPFLRDPRFLRRGALTCGGMTAILTYVGNSPLLLMGELGLSTGHYAALTAAMALVSLISAFATPWLLRRLGPAQVLATAHGAFALATLLLVQPAGTALPLLMSVFTLTCIGFSISFGVAMGEALAPCHHQAALASATLCIAQIAGSGAFIWLATLAGITPAGQLGLALLMAVLLYLATRRLPVLIPEES